jgi:hypothetical protein
MREGSVVGDEKCAAVSCEILIVYTPPWGEPFAGGGPLLIKSSVVTCRTMDCRRGAPDIRLLRSE